MLTPAPSATTRHAGSDSGNGSTRREFIRTTGRIAAASALAGVALPHVHASSESAVRLALIGCGGRGNGAVADAMTAAGLRPDDPDGRERAERSGAAGPLRLHAMADIRQDRLDGSHDALKRALGDLVDVPPERRFLGFDAYRHAIDSLRPGDIAILATFSSFRPIHLEYAVQKGVHVFMEKCFAPDPGGIHRLIRAGEAAEARNLKIAAGLMCRHSKARQALIEKIRNGEMGDIPLIRAYRMDPGYFMAPFPGDRNELLWQLSPGHPYQFLWASGGIFIELMIHQMDECFWIKDSWPVSAHGVGGRFAGSTDASQNLDSYSVEFAFADGARALVTGRYIPNCHTEFATFIHGTRCAAKFSGDIHAPTTWLYRGGRIDPSQITWRAPRETLTPWQAEWEVLLSAIRNDRPHNETRRAGLANLAAMMGRAAVHMGRVVTWEEMLASQFQFYPDIDSLNESSPAPVQAGPDGRYPAPIPGKAVEV